MDKTNIDISNPSTALGGNVAKGVISNLYSSSAPNPYLNGSYLGDMQGPGLAKSGYDLYNWNPITTNTFAPSQIDVVHLEKVYEFLEKCGDKDMRDALKEYILNQIKKVTPKIDDTNGL